MKNLLLIIAIAISFTANALASNIELNVTKESKEFILSTTVDTSKETVQFVFESNVSMIQVFNTAGDIEMILPIGSDVVDLGLSLFNPGTYKLGFVVDGIDDMQFSNLIIR